MRALGYLCLALGILLIIAGGIGATVIFTAVRGNVLWGVFCVATALAGAGVLIVAWVLLRRTATVDPGYVDGEFHRFHGDKPQSAELLGRGYRVFYQTPVKGKNGRPSLLRVSVPTESPESFSITRQSWFDRWAKNVGLAVEIDAGDADFDDACYIRTDSTDFTQAFVEDAGKRRAILELRALGFSEIALRDGEFQANWTGFDPLKNDGQDLLVEAAAHVLILAENLPEGTPHAPREDSPFGDQRSRSTSRAAYIGLWALLLTLAPAFFLVFWFKPVFTSELILTALPIVIPAYLLFAVLAFALLRGVSISHDRWAKQMWAGLAVFALGGVGAVAAINGLLDTAAPTLHRVTVVNTTTTRSRNSTTYYAVCESWRPGGGQLEFSISRPEHDSVQRGRSKMEVNVCPGKLGVEWIVGRRLVLQP